MNALGRKRILDALLRGSPPRLRKLIEEPCLRDLEALEPIIDDMVRTAVEEAVAWEQPR